MAKKKVANAAGELKVGDKVKALRSHNKAVEVTGQVSAIDGNSVTIEVDSAGGTAVEHEWFETVHIDDVTVLEAAKE